MHINLSTSKRAAEMLTNMIRLAGMFSHSVPGLANGKSVAVLISSETPIEGDDIDALTGSAGFALAVNDQYARHVDNKSFQVDNISDVGTMVHIYTDNQTVH